MWTQQEINHLLYTDIPIALGFLGAIIVLLLILILVTATKK